MHPKIWWSDAISGPPTTRCSAEARRGKPPTLAFDLPNRIKPAGRGEVQVHRVSFLVRVPSAFPFSPTCTRPGVLA